MWQRRQPGQEDAALDRARKEGRDFLKRIRRKGHMASLRLLQVLAACLLVLTPSPVIAEEGALLVRFLFTMVAPIQVPFVSVVPFLG